jgi:hypothetical protein
MDAITRRRGGSSGIGRARPRYTLARQARQSRAYRVSSDEVCRSGNAVGPAPPGRRVIRGMDSANRRQCESQGCLRIVGQRALPSLTALEGRSDPIHITISPRLSALSMAGQATRARVGTRPPPSVGAPDGGRLASEHRQAVGPDSEVDRQGEAATPSKKLSRSALRRMENARDSRANRPPQVRPRMLLSCRVDGGAKFSSEGCRRAPRPLPSLARVPCDDHQLQ